MQKAIENGPVEIVDLPMNSMVDLSSSLCKRFPEDSYKWAIYTMAMSNNHRVNQQVTIEIVDFPINNVSLPEGNHHVPYISLQ